jgi:8-oxo-dGTP pyrophosphatase MutT (NUDIX family)
MSKHKMVRTTIYAKAVIVHEGRALILRRSATHPTKAGRWDLPGGEIGNGEQPSDAVIREVAEETWLNIRPTHIVSLTETYGQPENPRRVSRWERITRAKVRTLGIVYVAEFTEGWDAIQLSSEHDEWAWVDRETVAGASTLAPKYRNAVLMALDADQIGMLPTRWEQWATELDSQEAATAVRECAADLEHAQGQSWASRFHRAHMPDAR